MALAMDPNLWAEKLAQGLRHEMLAAAEPLIEQAVENVRVAMRKRVAEMVTGLIDRSYQMDRDATVITIRVNLADPKERK